MQLRCEIIKKKRKKLTTVVIDPIPEASFYSYTSLSHHSATNAVVMEVEIY